MGDELLAMLDTEDVVDLNAAWLRALPNLAVRTAAELQEEVARRVRSIPGRAEQIARARATRPLLPRAIEFLIVNRRRLAVTAVAAALLLWCLVAR